MSQLLRELDFGIAGEARRRLEAGNGAVQLNLDHDGQSDAYHVPAIKCLVKTAPEAVVGLDPTRSL